jgi:hypothetical protein
MSQRQHLEVELSTFTIEDAYRILEALGPMPSEALSALVDYGLSDSEIGQYLNLPQDMITTLRKHWQLSGDP